MSETIIIEDKESVWLKFRKYMRNNVTSNISKIAANFGSMITTIITILLYAVKAQLDWVTTIIVIMCAIPVSYTHLTLPTILLV